MNATTHNPPRPGVPHEPIGTVRIEKRVTVGHETAWLLTTYRLTETRAVAFLAEHGSEYRRCPYVVDQ